MTKIGRDFAEQLLIAADDPATTIGTMRQAMRDAAGVMQAQQELNEQWRAHLRMEISVATGLLIATWLCIAIVVVVYLF
jgi:hypothetical protein